MAENKKIPIERIIVTGDNPRREFDEEGIKNLAESIKTYGLLQPIMVRPANGNYELITGERRLRACKLIGLTEIDARVETVDDSTSMEMRLIENTQRKDLTDAEKGDAIYALIERFPDKYSRVGDVAKAIGKPSQTVWVWANKSMRLSDHIRNLIETKQLSEKISGYLLKFDHDTQNKLADIIVNYPLTEGQATKFIKLFDKTPDVKLSDLADKAKGVKKVTVDISELSPETRKEVEDVLKERKRKAKIARRKAVAKARKAPWKSKRKQKPRGVDVISSKAGKLEEKIKELEPSKREDIVKRTAQRIDYLTKKVEVEQQIEEDKETRELYEKWKANIANKVKKETPERFVMDFDETLLGLISQIGAEYPPSVKEVGQRELVKPISTNQLENLDVRLRIAINELDSFRNVVASELFSRKTKIK
jgi:ParB family chromosome partitioning protein